MFIKSATQCALQIGQKLFGRYLLVTNATISACMGATGDTIQQHYDILTDQKESWHLWRTQHMTVAGLTTGIITHYWYIFLDRALPGSCLRTVVKKVLYDQVFFSPVNLAVYFGTLGVLEGSQSEAVKEELFHKGAQIYLVEWIVWPPAQMLNFYLLPTRFRVAFDNIVSLGFDIYSPYVKYKERIKTEK
ncbi:mpv17-like protein 2 [Limulus polyphemus]|uniref:Mpv17-like protein 2 n=1 Tax=Limulus polyphemus TaxID=6850 RepID=A0ABM1B8H8_LIMPO|nr:mpv17-like protein 2 [Limulus polyphemus]XP_013776949.1 mpv17-like protein 2 [Limulus polyphemus]